MKQYRGRPRIDPEKKKRPVSFTLTAEQRTLCEWTAAKLDVSASEMIGKLIEKEAKRVAKAKQQPMPNTDQEKMKL